ncbi:MAG: ATP-binding cassette domain-containing protein, partial [Actinomycetes bacterium]
MDHPTVALHHARIVRKGAEANIEDRSGGLGLAVNGRRTNRARLEVGDQISIGPFRILYDGSDFYERAPVGGLPVAAVGVRVDVDTGTILNPTTISLRPGELVAIIGESGAGKSTLLKALAGVSQPSSGRILVGGEDVMQRLPEIGYVPQFDIVHELLSVREALDYAAQLRLPADTSQAERESRVTEVIEQLRLTERADVRVGRLSGGQRKRAAVGIEIMHKPGALFLDEPTTGLDPGLEKEMMLLFRSLADAGQTVSLVTHATGSLSICDRAVVMGRGGHLLFDGKPGDLLTAFGIDSFDALYEEFDRRSRAGLVGPQNGFALDEWGDLELQAENGVKPPRKEVQQTLGYQTRVLTRRYATLLRRDSKHLASAFGQVPILAMFCAFLFHMSVFDKQSDPNNPVPLSAGLAALLVFMMVVITVWLGSVNAAREVVKERLVTRREFAIGVQIPAYIASKLIVLFVFVTAQTLLFSLIVLVLRPPHETGAAILGLVFVLVIGSCVSVLTGLLVSAASTIEDQAVGLIPLILVPQLLFAGAIVQVAQIPTYLRWLTNFIPTRWSFAASGNALGMTDRISSDPQAAKATHYGNFFNTSAAA